MRRLIVPMTRSIGGAAGGDGLRQRAVFLAVSARQLFEPGEVVLRLLAIKQAIQPPRAKDRIDIEWLRSNQA